jgi:hypothetical protein
MDDETREAREARELGRQLERLARQAAELTRYTSAMVVVVESLVEATAEFLNEWGDQK